MKFHGNWRKIYQNYDKFKIFSNFRPKAGFSMEEGKKGNFAKTSKCHYFLVCAPNLMKFGF